MDFHTSSQQGPLIFLFIKNSSRLDVLVPNTWEKFLFQILRKLWHSAWKRQEKNLFFLKTITSHFSKLCIWKINKSLYEPPEETLWYMKCNLPHVNPKQFMRNKNKSQWQNNASWWHPLEEKWARSSLKRGFLSKPSVHALLMNSQISTTPLEEWKQGSENHSKCFHGALQHHCQTFLKFPFSNIMRSKHWERK